MTQRHARMFAAAVTAGALFTAIDLSAQSQIRGCTTQGNGQLRLLGDGETCKKNETPVTWGIQGPKGDTGSPGPGLDTGSIAGRLDQCGPLTAQSGMPYVFVGVAGQSFTAVTDANGNFQISYVPPGLYELIPTGSFVSANPVAVTAGQVKQLGTILSTNLQTDSKNCGACGVVCPANQACVAGACQSIAGQVCSPSCTAGFMCILGACAATSPGCAGHGVLVGGFCVCEAGYSGTVCQTGVITYSWITSAFSACNLPCGGGIQTRTVQCRASDGTNVADFFCATAVKPTTIQGCNPQACGGAQ